MEVAAKHTPTPWEQSDAFGATEVGTCVKAVADNNMIASCTGYYGRDGAIANAAFIVRACNSHDNLVDALQEAVDALAGGLWDFGPEQDEHQKCDEVIERCRAVLASVVLA
jgi:hypothetical protein